MRTFPAGFILLFSALFCTSIAGSAQTTEQPKTSATLSDIQKPSRDFLMLQFTYEGWANTPDSIKTGGFGRGFNGYLCYDFPIHNSHMSVAIGAGVGSANIYLDNQEMRLRDTGVAGNQVTFAAESKDYKKFKINTTYLEAPIELRYFANNANRNKGFKAAIGMRAGLLIGAKTKDVTTYNGVKTVEKVNSKRYLDKYRFSATARIGYGNFSLFGSYNINALFAEGSGPDITPWSVGLCITGL
jgi:hypothetical protein